MSYTPLHFEFTTDVHLRLLLRLGRGQAAERAVRAAVKLGDRVLDAGTGTGLLSYFAARAGAAQIVAVDRVQIDLAREIARENNLLDRIQFVEADLSAPIAEIQGRFDVLLAFMYTNDIVRDEERARLIHHLRRRFGNDDCVVVPSEVRYSAQACDWPARDLQTQQLYIRDAAASLESAYGYKFTAVIERTAEEAAYYLACPEYEGEYPWLPGGDAAATRFMRTGLRLLSGAQPFATHRYDAGHPFEP